MRIFYAVTFTGKTKNAILELQQELGQYIKRGSFIDRENFHITLHFIGEIEDGELELFKGYLDQAALGISPFELRFTSYGSFRQGQQDLIYLKTKSSGKIIPELAERLFNLCMRGDDRPAKPHVTLVRKAVIPHETLKVLKKRHLNFPAIKVESLSLMESRHIDGKIVYLPLYSVKL